MRGHGISEHIGAIADDGRIKAEALTFWTDGSAIAANSSQGIVAGRDEFTYTKPMTGLPQGDSPLLLNCSYTITAEIEIPQGGAEGMLATDGGRFGGIGPHRHRRRPARGR